MRLSPASLPGRLLAWILPISLGVILAVSTATYLIARSVILSEAQQGVQAVSEAAAARVKAYFELRETNLMTVSQSPLFRDHYMNVEYGLEQEARVYRGEIARMLEDLSARTQAFPRLQYLDAEGREVCAVQEGRASFPGAPFEDRVFLAATARLKAGQRVVSGLKRVPWHESPVVLYGTPLIGKGGRLRGVLVFSASLAPVYDFLGRLHLGISGRSFLTERRPGEAGPRLSGDLLTATVAVPGTPWSVITAVQRADFTERLAWVALGTLLMALAAAAVLGLLLVRQVRVLLKPIELLSGAVSSYAKGRLEARVRAEGTEEVAALGRAFNLMADRLERRTGELVQRVQELTSLHRMNEAVLRQLGRGAIARACLDAVVEGLGFGRAALFWVDSESGELVGECVSRSAGVEYSPEQIRLRRLPLSGGDLLARAAREGRALWSADAANDPACDAELARVLEAGPLCAAPVAARERVVAVLAVTLPQAPPDNLRMRSLSLFCGAAGLALDNARLLESTLSSEARHRTAVENSPHAVVSLDQNLRITLWNRRAEALFGYQPSEAYGRTLALVLGEKPYQGLKRRVETEGVLRQSAAEGRTRDGRRLDLSVSWTGQDAGPGGAREWFVVIQDETERKRMEGQLIQAEKMTAVGNLISGVAHELNNPLGAVIGFAELLKDLPLSGEKAEDLRMLHASALRCRDIVQGLLSFVRQGRGDKRRLPLNAVVQESLALFEYRLIKREGVRLEVDLDPAGPEAAGEFQRLQQVLVNLFSNAADALKDRRGPRVVRVRTRALPEGSIIEVEDTGPGVPPEERARVFEPFYTTKPAGQGTGLGLSISAQIAAEFGGILRCGEGPEGGARFTLELPACPADLPATPAPTALPQPVAGRKVLVVDDEPELVALMTRLLSEDGLLAFSAAPGEAVKRVVGEDFDLVITDVDMGPIKGTTLADAARAAGRDASWVFVTGDVLNSALSEELARRGAPVLSKPFLRTDFLRLVRHVLRERNPDSPGRRSAGRKRSG